MNGSIAIGSRRTTPTAPVAAAVGSDDRVPPMKVPWVQSRASVTSGIVVLRRPPNRMASIGTPFGSSYSGARIGHCLIGVQYRLLGWLDSLPEPGVHGSRFHHVARCWLFSSPSHQTS